jgi:hypothetical protein
MLDVDAQIDFGEWIVRRPMTLEVVVGKSLASARVAARGEAVLQQVLGVVVDDRRDEGVPVAALGIEAFGSLDDCKVEFLPDNVALGCCKAMSADRSSGKPANERRCRRVGVNVGR